MAKEDGRLARLRLRKETKRFKLRAINSLQLAIELFNRPQEMGRTEAVLILLQHAFEMLLKAAIFQTRGTVIDPGEDLSHSFKRCLGIARGDLNILDDNQIFTLSSLYGLRNDATHNLIDLSEQSLYLHTQAAVTLFDQILGSAFGESVADHFPNRVLPVSTAPPQDMLILLDSEFSQIKALLSPGNRRQAEARGRLRQFLIMESNLSGDGEQPKDRDLNRLVRRLKRDDTDWQTLFPGLGSLRLNTQGQGLNVAIRFTREEGAAPVRVLRESEPGVEDAGMIREVDLLQRYSMGLKSLARNLELTEPKTLALVRYLDLQSDEACFREFHPGTFANKRYSPEALRRLRGAKDQVDMDEVWQKYGSRRRVANS